MCRYNHTWHVKIRFLTAQSISTLVIVFVNVLVQSLCSMKKNYSDPPLHSDPTLYPPVQETPEVWAELDRTLSGGGFVH